MNNRFIYYGWNVSKNNNLYKLIDGECYTISRCKNSFTVITDEYKIKGLSSIMEAKEEIYNIAYGENYYNSSNEYFDNPIFAEIVKHGYKQLSKKYHPDVSGGDDEKMKLLNNLYDGLKTKLLARAI